MNVWHLCGWRWGCCFLQRKKHAFISSIPSFHSLRCTQAWHTVEWKVFVIVDRFCSIVLSQLVGDQEALRLSLLFGVKWSEPSGHCQTVSRNCHSPQSWSKTRCGLPGCSLGKHEEAVPRLMLNDEKLLRFTICSLYQWEENPSNL